MLLVGRIERLDHSDQIAHVLIELTELLERNVVLADDEQLVGRVGLQQLVALLGRLRRLLQYGLVPEARRVYDGALVEQCRHVVRLDQQEGTLGLVQRHALEIGRLCEQCQLN